MNFTIKSRKLKKDFSFWKNSSDSSSYVFLESPGNPGCLGRQICRGGGFMGSTIMATEGNFESVCRKWYRQHLKDAIEDGCYE